MKTVVNNTAPSWNDLATLAFAREKAAMAAFAEEAIRSMEIQANQRALLIHDGPADTNPLLSAVFPRFDALNVSTHFWERNIARVESDLRSENPARIGSCFEEARRCRELIEASDHIFLVRSPKQSVILSEEVPSDLRTSYTTFMTDSDKIRRTKSYNIVFLPSPQLAAQEGMSLVELEEVIFRSWCQPWLEIHKAQEHLREMLDAGKALRIVSNHSGEKKTDITMSIEGMTFWNSTTKNNFPGAEVFSAPVRESVNGTIFAPGMFRVDEVQIRDIFLKFENGRVTYAEASMGEDKLKSLLSTPGCDYLGEVAFGNNPALFRPFINPLYAEKRSGSWHFALGSAYPDRTVVRSDGEHLVRLHNGNTSSRHVDISMSLLPAFGGGSIFLDSREIQRNGKWIDPLLYVLHPNLC